MSTLETGYIALVCISAIFFMVHLYEEVVASGYDEEIEEKD
tara:strand:- start:83 stop:205 length:123 start_codon:yes stop_codon:yes gene_type:complete